ncbi:MAG: Gfo/Idh/MocA family oxidoreductase [Clostridia bacterium]|nr:Gfo/Idh/MocA family oxidoreductase [Clostridia bacterium]
MEQVRFGLVGLGSMGLQHAKTIMESVREGRLAAVASRNEKHISVLRGLPGGDALCVFDTPKEMYESGCIDAVLIASPHRAHVVQAKEAFACGMHVLLEKPTGVFTREVRELNEAAERSGKAFGVMFNQRTNPVYRKMKEIVASGELGEIRRTSVIITDWFRAQSYYDSGAWRATWKQDGGGVLLNQAPHNLDLWQWICGMPVKVHAFCGFGRWHDVEIEDDVTAYVEYANGATGTFITCTGEVPGTNRFEISMDGGQLVYENGRLILAKPETPASVFIREYPGGFGQPAVTREDITPEGEYPMHAGVIRAFARHILYGEDLVAQGCEGLSSLMLANAMVLSGWTGKSVELPMDEAADAAFEALLVGHASKSKERVVKPIDLNVASSFK